MSAYRINLGLDGFWYLDAKATPNGTYKGESRHATLDGALNRIRELEKGAKHGNA